MKTHKLSDTHQSWWQLSVIQLSGWMSLPTFGTSIFLLQKNSFLGSILTIIVANAILWFIRLIIIMMSHDNRKSTLDISRDYLGRFGSYFIAVLLLLGTLAWFMMQTNLATDTLTHLISLNENPKIDQFIQVSVFLGMISTLLCIEGIVLLRWLCTFTFPILCICFAVIFFSVADKIPLANGHPLSLSGLGLVLATNLGISADFPTFFRHSKSWTDSIKALLLIQVINIVLGIMSLYFGSLFLKEFDINESLILASGSTVFIYGMILFIFFSVISANVANVYSASVGWELLAPAALVGRKEYFILGLCLTIIFILFVNVVGFMPLLEFCDSSLVFLCIIFVVGYLIRKWLKKEPDRLMQNIYFIGWFLASLSYILQLFFFNSFAPLMIGLITLFLVIFCSLGVILLKKRKPHYSKSEKKDPS